MSWDEARCQFSVNFATDTLAALKAMLQPENFMEADCRVIKHPRCCAYCAANNDCARLPIHPQCRCRPKHYLIGLDE